MSFPEPKPPPIICVTADPAVRKRVERAAREMEALLLGFGDPGEAELPAPPRVFVIDLRVPGARGSIAAWRTEFRQTPIVGVLAVPDPGLWREAEQAGADFVTTPGAVHRQLAGFLEQYARRTSGRRRVRVADEKDLAGRLGLVTTSAEGLPEEIALYRAGSALCAAANTCPHAGARLSEGELAGSVITCPLHGSQFDVCTGERLRGPADDPIPTYKVIVESGSVFVEFEET